MCAHEHSHMLQGTLDWIRAAETAVVQVCLRFQANVDTTMCLNVRKGREGTNEEEHHRGPGCGGAATALCCEFHLLYATIAYESCCSCSIHDGEFQLALWPHDHRRAICLCECRQ